MKLYSKLVIYNFMLAIAFSSCHMPSDPQNATWPLIGFNKQDELNPILFPDKGQTFLCPKRDSVIQWEARNVLNPTAFVKDNKVYLVYRAQDEDMTSRLGLAISEDGLNFKKESEPIFYPANDDMIGYEWPGGVEDPRIVESESGEYILTYTAYDGKVARLFIASSIDLHTWTKHGPVLGEGKYLNTWSKAGAIVSRLEGNRIIATKIDGKYWMYFGDTELFIATSDDLKVWDVLEDTQLDKKISVLHPRRGFFDSRLVEPGPFALLQEDGILLIYNSMNAKEYNDESLPVGTYAAGQALFEKTRPYQLKDRMTEHFIHPDKDYERVGEVNEVCFVEGLVFFKEKWFLYYGTADSKIAVAVRD